MTLRELYNYVLAAISKRPLGMGSPAKQKKSMKRANVVPVIPFPSALGVKNRPTESFVSSLGGSDREIGDYDDEIKDETHDAGESKEAEKKVTFVAPDTHPRHDDKPAPAPGTKGHVTYRERLGGYLHPRDMRRLVTPFSSSNAQEIMVRRHVILLNCDPLRAIVLRDRLLMLVPDDAESLLEILTKRIIGGRAEMEDSVFGASPVNETPEDNIIDDSKSGKDIKRSESNLSGITGATAEETDESEEYSEDDEWKDIEGRGWIDMPFELKAVDAVLNSVSIMLAEDVELLQEAVYDTIDEVLSEGRTVRGDHNQKIFRSLKNAIKEMSHRIDNFVRAINEALDDLEDLSLMNLSRLITHPELFIQPVPRSVLEEESDEPELILEVFMQQALSTANQVDLLKGQITTSEELMAMQLDTVRNRLLLINAIVSLFTLTLSVAALVGSIYGMNVIIGLEDDPDAFTKIVAGTSVACVIFLCLLLYIFYRALALPHVLS